MGSLRLSGFAASATRFIVMAAAFIAAVAAEMTARADYAFQYGPVVDPILSAQLSIDVAAMTAHRTVGGNEVNFVRLVDVSGGLGTLDLSSSIFGAANYPAPPVVNQAIQTGVLTASINAAFFPALAAGQLGLWALLTDTGDGLFAIDTIRLDITTTSGTISSFYGSSNNGFGLGIGDGGNLPSPLPGQLPFGTTGTGFDETISSKMIYVIPAPPALAILLIGVFTPRRRRRAEGSPMKIRTTCSHAAVPAIIAAVLLALPALGDGPSDPPDPNLPCGTQPPDADSGCLQDGSAVPYKFPFIPKPEGGDETPTGDPLSPSTWTVTGYDVNSGEFTLPFDPDFIELDPDFEGVTPPGEPCVPDDCLGGIASVIGADGRIEVTNTNPFPWCSVCFIEMKFPNGKTYIGSGALVGPRHVLTAGHNVHDNTDGGWATSVTVYPGSKDWAKANPRPFGKAEMTKMYSYTGWTVNKLRAHDFAIIVLDSNIGNRVGWFGKWAGDTDVNEICHLPQYPGDKPKGSQWNHWGRPAGETAFLMYHPIDTFQGSSGSPIYRLADTPPVRYIRAVHTAGVGDGNPGQGNNNVGTRLTKGKFDHINEWVAANPALPEPEFAGKACAVCGPDCNGNGVADAQDIALGFSLDFNGDGIPDECQADQLHILGPIPNQIFVGATGTVTAVVERAFAPLPDRSVVMRVISGDLSFTAGGIIQPPDSKTIVGATDGSGQVTATFTGNATGTALIEVSLPGTPLVTYAFVQVVDPATAIPGDVNHDGVVNIDDLLAVVNAWGASGSTPADVAPFPFGNGFVNIDDLLMVINHWG